MATGTQLERIAGLSDRVTPLRGKQRGMRIEADDWNSLVDAFLGILEVERVQEGGGESILDQRFAGRNHAHLGEVDADWLDTDLQTRLSGGVGSISTRAGLADLQKRIDAVAAEVALADRADGGPAEAARPVDRGQPDAGAQAEHL